MMQNFEFKRGGRKCSVSGTPFQPGEEFYSALIEQADGSTERVDYSNDNWDGKPEHCIGFWWQRIPDLEGGKVYWAPADILMAYFQHVLEQPNKQDTALVMSLVLQQKRILYLKDQRETDEGNYMILFNRRTKETFEVLEVDVTAERTIEIQAELSEQLFSDQPMVDESNLQDSE